MGASGGVCGVWAAGAAWWPRDLGVRGHECVHTCVWASGGLGPARTARKVRCARESGVCAGGRCACNRGSEVAWSRRAERGRAGLCARMCARGRRRALSWGSQQLSWGMPRWSGPGRPHPAPSGNLVPSLPLHPASPLRSDRDPPLGSSKAQRGAGDPGGSLPGPLPLESEQGEAGEEGEAAKMLLQPRRGPLRPLSPQLEGGCPQHLLSGPASPWAGCLCFHLPLSVLPLPCALFSHPGVQGRAVEVRGRSEVGVGWALGVSWYQASSWSEGCQERPSAGSRAGGSQDLWVCRGWKRRV